MPGRISATALALALSFAWAGQGVSAEFFTLKGHGGPVRGIDVAPDGTIATVSFDNSVGIWQEGTPRWLEAHRAATNAVVWIDDGRVASGGDDNDIWLWDLSGSAGIRLTGHTAKVLDLAVSPDGRWLASASWDARVGLWDLADPSAPPRYLNGHRQGVNALAFSVDGQRLYSGSTDGTILMWDATTGNRAGQFLNNGFGVNKLVVNEAAGWLAYGAIDGVTRVIDLASGAQVRDLTLGRRPVLALAASPDFSLLAIGDGEGYISILDTSDWTFAADFRATLRGPVWALHFSLDGKSIHAGGLDTAMYSWPLDGLKDAERMVSETPSFLIKPEEQSNGERQYNRKCSICHALGPDGERRAGPTLHGVFGRKAGTLPDYAYSQTLDLSAIVWSEQTIDALFDIGPDDYITGSKMPQQIIADPKDRDDLITFLKTATQNGGE